MENNEIKNAIEYFLQGLDCFNKNDFMNAIAFIEKSVNLENENGLFRFYLAVAISENFTKINEFFSYPSMNKKYSSAYEKTSLDNMFNEFMKKTIFLLNEKEKELLENKFNLKLDNEKSFAVSLFCKVLSSSKVLSGENYNAIKNIYPLFGEEDKNLLNNYLINHFSNTTFKEDDLKKIYYLLLLLKDNITDFEYNKIKDNLTTITK